MLMAIGIMLAVMVLIILAISAFKRTKKAKKFLVMAEICFVIMFISACSDTDKEKPINSAATEKTTENAQAPTPASSTPATTVSQSATSEATLTSQQKEEVNPLTEPGTKRISAKMTKVVDGDTMNVSFEAGGQIKNEKIRLLLVDTPETVAPNRPVEPFGPEASAFAKQTLSGKDVQLEIDVSERDKYGRLLCYLYVGDQMFNELLLEKGLARVAYVYPPNVRYVDQFRDIQKTAQQSGVGIWSIENYAQEDGFHDEAMSSASKTTSSPTTRPAVVPTPAENPEKVDSNVYYKNCTAVKAAGAAPLMKGEPGYSSKLDRDGDGVACEK